MRDINEKYIELNRSFPNKAGKLLQIITTQKRLVEKLVKTKQTPESEALLISVAEGYDVTLDLLNYMKNVLQGVANDAEALLEGSAIRNTVRLQNELISNFIAKQEEEVEAIRKRHESTRKD